MKILQLTLFLSIYTTACFSSKVSQTFGIRIIGGTDAYSAQFPFAAAITVQTATSRFFCGGTLVNHNWIVTSGQCVDGAVLFTIQLGSNQLTGEDPNRVKVATSEYILHSDYNPNTLENDIGLIKLRIPVEYTRWMNKVKWLGYKNIVENTTFWALGWGQTSDDNPEYSNNLQRVKVTSISNDECKLYYGNQINNNTVCVKGNYNEGSCYGDTGSALIQDHSKGILVLEGIASFISGNGCESTDPSGYLKFHPYREWVKEKTGA